MTELVGQVCSWCVWSSNGAQHNASAAVIATCASYLLQFVLISGADALELLVLFLMGLEGYFTRLAATTASFLWHCMRACSGAALGWPCCNACPTQF